MKLTGYLSGKIYTWFVSALSIPFKITGQTAKKRGFLSLQPYKNIGGFT